MSFPFCRCQCNVCPTPCYLSRYKCVLTIQSSFRLKKRASRLCRASVSHVAAFILYRPRKLRDSGQPRHYPTTFLRERQSSPRQRESRSGSVSRCLRRAASPAPTHQTNRRRETATDKTSAQCVACGCSPESGLLANRQVHVCFCLTVIIIF